MYKHTVEREVRAEIADDEEGGVGDPGRQSDVGLARVVRRPELAHHDAERRQAHYHREHVGRSLEQLQHQDVGLKWNRWTKRQV